MSRFNHVLKRAEHRLEVPEPERSRILLEMAQDLEDLYAVYRERGHDEAEAVRRAERLLGTSSEAIEGLERVHAPLYMRLLGRLSEPGRHRTERLLLTALTLTAVAGGGYSLAASEFIRSPSPFVWAVLAVAAAAARAMERLGGQVGTGLVAGGLRLTLITSVFGLSVFGLALLLWLALRWLAARAAQRQPRAKALT